MALQGICGAAEAPATPCPAIETRISRIAAIDDRLEILLADGTKLRLYGVEPPASAEGARVSADLRAWLGDHDLGTEFLSTTVDRWGRRVARVFPTAENRGGIALSVAEALIDAGQARVRLEPGPVACLSKLLFLENKARAEEAGLWADPANAPIPASRREAFAERGGQYVIVEGRVTGVGETATRLYLNFGPIRTVDFSVTMTKATIKALTGFGVDPRALTGVRMRVRGVLDLRFGPQIEIVHPAAIELMK